MDGPYDFLMCHTSTNSFDLIRFALFMGCTGLQENAEDIGRLLSVNYAAFNCALDNNTKYKINAKCWEGSSRKRGGQRRCR